MKINKKCIPSLLFAFVFYLICYELPKVLVDYNNLHYLISDIDLKINLYSASLIIYIGAFFQWFFVSLTMLKQDKDIIYRFLSMMMIGSFIGFICFIIYPTGIYRPIINGENIFDKLMILMYSVDSVANACPSFHCFVSTAVTIGLFIGNNINSKYKIFNIIFSILVFLSTLLTKQHYLIDIPAGILLAFISFYLSKYICFNKLFDKLNNEFNL